MAGGGGYAETLLLESDKSNDTNISVRRIAMTSISLDKVYGFELIRTKWGFGSAWTCCMLVPVVMQ